MLSYYYLMSSLPMLRAEGNTPVTYQRFLELCRTAVSKTRYSELESLTLRSDKGPLVREWAKFYQAFSSELTFIRNEKRGLQFKGAYFHDTALSGAISAAISGKNPLEAENALIKLQFEKVAANEVLSYHFHPTQKIKQNEDGTVTVKFKASGDYEILWHLFRWGTTVKIISPKSLKNKYIEMLSTILSIQNTEA